MLILAGPAAEAGPWPRAPGTKFLSLSVERDRESNSYTGLYAEYGMDARNTLGFELGHTNVGETSAMIWWQRALDDGSGPNYRRIFSAARSFAEVLMCEENKGKGRALKTGLSFIRRHYPENAVVVTLVEPSE